MIRWLTVVLRLAVAGLKSRQNLLPENLARANENELRQYHKRAWIYSDRQS